MIADIECNWVKADQHRKLALPQIDVSFIYDSIKVIPVRGIAYPDDKFQQLLARTLHRPMSAHSREYAMSPPSHLRSPAYSGTNKPKPTAKYVRELYSHSILVGGIGGFNLYHGLFLLCLAWRMRCQNWTRIFCESSEVLEVLMRILPTRLSTSCRTFLNLKKSRLL